MHADVPGYDELQEQAGRAAAGLPVVEDVLDLGTGTGETAERILGLYPRARLTGVDVSPYMLAAGRAKLGAEPALIVARLEDPLPPGPYDLVFSALAVHHLDGEGKRDLFGRVAGVLRPAGRFVLADVVVPEDPAEAVVPLTPDFDRPDSAADQVAWLGEAGFDARMTWSLRDLAVFAAELR
ncbi:MAG: class I SAM-dependent methyltransferase [Thermoleophilia bacterium]|nr:class I SAM-dependent methyltransferase [Thermoleophilia bacterium]